MIFHTGSSCGFGIFEFKKSVMISQIDISKSSKLFKFTSDIIFRYIVIKATKIYLWVFWSLFSKCLFCFSHIYRLFWIITSVSAFSVIPLSAAAPWTALPATTTWASTSTTSTSLPTKTFVTFLNTTHCLHLFFLA